MRRGANVIPRIYLYAAAVLVIGGLYWRYTYVVHQRDAAEILVTNLTATLAGERKNRAIEQADRRQADEIVKPVEVKLARIAVTPDPVGVYCRPAKLPAAASQSGSPASVVSAPVDRGPEAPLRDIGSALGAARREAESNNARNEGLIKFEIERKH